MVNEILWFVMMLVNFGLILGFYKLFGRKGLYSWMAFAIVVANIQVLKNVELFGFVITLGNIMYGTLFLVTDILNEVYGKEEAKKAVWIGFLTMISSTFLMWLSIQFIPHQSDFAHGAIRTIFDVMPRITLASLVAYIISNLHDVWAFQFWKEVFEGRYLWLRNNLSTITSQLIDTGIFCFIAFWGRYELPVFMNILWTTLFLKILVAWFDTPFIYIARKFE